MSLQVWLPLNGDLHNQGLSNLIFTTISTNTTIDNNGKIGKCYANNSTSAGGLISNQTIDLGQQQSMFCWFKFTNLTSNSSLGAGLVSQHRYSSNQGMGITIRYVSSTTGYLSVNTGNGSSRTYNTYYGTTLLQANTWYHGGYTYDGTNIRIYVNGKLEKTQAYANMAVPADYLTVFCWSTSGTSGNTTTGNYKLNGAINDVRIYDHALSDKEVEEIAKGLVLHYKLNGSEFKNPNLLLDTNVSSLTKVKAPNNRYYESSSSGTYTAVFESINDPPVANIKYGVHYTVTSASGFHSLTWYSGGTISVTNEPYTMSCYVKKISTENMSIKFQYGKSPYVSKIINLINDNEWHQYSWTFIPDTASGKAAASGTTRIYAGGPSTVGEAIICGWKLEKGDCVTPWCESENEGFEPSLIIYDSSGYQNNGEVINTITIGTDSPRYKAYTHFSATNQKIKISGLSTIGFSNSYTFAWWEKISSVSPMHWGFSDGVRLNGMYTGRLWNTGDGSNNPLYNPGTTTQVTAPSVNVWHHWAMVGNGTKCLVYQDGELWAEAKTYKTITGTTIFINGWNTSTDYSSDNASISDFRLYSTALTAEQIKELYNISASIDNKGNIYAREVVE